MRTPGPEGGRALLVLGGDKYLPQWERLLRECGFPQTERAASGGEARRLLLSGDWDLLLIAAPLPDEQEGYALVVPEVRGRGGPALHCTYLQSAIVVEEIFKAYHRL